MIREDLQSSNNEAAVVADIARDSVRLGQEVVPSPGTLHVNVTNRDEDLDIRSYEQHLPEPVRPRTTFTVTEPASFTALLADEPHNGALIFADETLTKLTAIINWDGWGDHRIVLQLTPSDQFKRWSAKSGQFLNQMAFAEMLEDFARDIIDPDAATMIETAQSFQAASSVSFESSARLSNGTIGLSYREETEAKAGNAGQLEVPEMFLLRFPILRGGDPVDIIAKLRYRIDRKELRLGLRVPGLEDYLSEAFVKATADVLEGLNEAHGHRVVYGPAPAPVAPQP